MELERERSEFYIRFKRGVKFFEGARDRFDLQGSSGGGRGLRVFCQETTSDNIQRAKLLRLVRQFRGDNER